MQQTSRNLALVVRYWAVNMTLIHNRGSNWPGFGYSDDEKKELLALAVQVPKGEFFVFAAIKAVMAIAIFGLVVIAGMNGLIAAIGGEQNMPQTPASMFFLSLALELVVSLSVGLPVAMLITAALVGRCFKVVDSCLPDRSATGRYFHKLWFQITRIAVVMTCAVLPLWIWVPNDSKFMVMIRVVAPLLSPVVSVLTMIYYFSARLQEPANHS
jgi:hypothetical protein